MKINKFLALGATALLIFSCAENEPISSIEAEETSEFTQAEEAFSGKKGTIKQGFYEGEKIEYEVFGNTAILEGDIEISSEQIYENTENFVLMPDQNPNESKSVGRTQGRWPNNTVYYRIDSGLSKKYRVTDAIAHWESRTNLKFVERSNQSNYISFVSGSGCSSSVGMVGGQQYIRLASGCSTGNTIHEIGHAVGLYHEQSRADRDQYLTINFDNIQSGKEHNFRTYKERRRDGAEYTNDLDFGSIMMYGPYSFAKNRSIPTITRKNGSTYSVQRDALSSGDLVGINKMYPDDTENPTYENNKWYTLYGLRVYRYNDQWWYWSDRYGWEVVVYRDGAWYYKNTPTPR